MQKPSIRLLKILEISVWGVFLIFILMILNGYLKEEELLFYENPQKKIILGSSWGKSLQDIARICDLKEDELEIGNKTECYIDGDRLIFKNDVFQIIEGVPLIWKNDTLNIYYYFFDNQLYSISIWGYNEGVNDFKNLFERKFGEFNESCEYVINFSFLKRTRKELAKAFGWKFECIDTKDIFIDYLDSRDELFTKKSYLSIELFYKPLISKIKKEQYSVKE